LRRSMRGRQRLCRFPLAGPLGDRLVSRSGSRRQGVLTRILSGPYRSCEYLPGPFRHAEIREAQHFEEVSRCGFACCGRGLEVGARESRGRCGRQVQRTAARPGAAPILKAWPDAKRPAGQLIGHGQRVDSVRRHPHPRHRSARQKQRHFNFNPHGLIGWPCILWPSGIE
jgi:hypothetical protein